ncbi:MAG: prephenate dehydrogenase/arogenate dehydrogenase family protein [Spirochaetaceae bacterium]|nr:prephenate dehydrogenase/arogenate dehydrogenase family protein [Spirochaetaceae bacterium]
MTIGVVGLGLIGGSVSKAIKHSTPHTVLGYDISEPVVCKAKLLDAIDGFLSDDRIPLCDMIIIATYPQICVDFLEQKASLIKKETIVMDCCGIKDFVCKKLFPLAKKNGFIFIGAHPMAGIEFSGFDNAQHKLFSNASIILTPSPNTDLETLQQVKKFWGSLGFTNFEITNPERHDKIIAYTSQLAHVVSSAFIKSKTALEHLGFSAGSYKDMTRVARLNENMWTELFLENADNLSTELDELITNLQEYSKALKNRDEKKLKALLKEGREAKELADKGDMSI